VVGGVNADLTEARFDTTESILTKISLVGGVSMTVPHDVDLRQRRISEVRAATG